MLNYLNELGKLSEGSGLPGISQFILVTTIQSFIFYESES